jgi:hypothetical protein
MLNNLIFDHRRWFVCGNNAKLVDQHSGFSKGRQVRLNFDRRAMSFDQICMFPPTRNSHELYACAKRNFVSLYTNFTPNFTSTFIICEQHRQASDAAAAIPTVQDTTVAVFSSLESFEVRPLD